MHKYLGTLRDMHVNEILYSMFILKSHQYMNLYHPYQIQCTLFLVMCKVYTDERMYKIFIPYCPPVRKIIHALKLVDYLHVQTDSSWYNYYIKIMSVR